MIEVGRRRARLELFHASDVPLAGVHNLENAMAAALLARAVGVRAGGDPRRPSRASSGLPHRLEKVGEAAASPSTTTPRGPTRAPR